MEAKDLLKVFITFPMVLKCLFVFLKIGSILGLKIPFY